MLLREISHEIMTFKKDVKTLLQTWNGTKQKKANLDTLTAKPQTTSRWAKRAENSPVSFPKIQNLADLLFSPLSFTEQILRDLTLR